jgi:hypothetical protein
MTTFASPIGGRSNQMMIAFRSFVWLHFSQPHEIDVVGAAFNTLHFSKTRFTEISEDTNETYSS